MWQGTGSTNQWNLSCYSPRVQAALFGFRWFVRGGGGSTAAARTLDTVADERGRRWQMVWQGPRLGFVAETGRFIAMETAWVRFSCLLTTWLVSFFWFVLYEVDSIEDFSRCRGYWSILLSRLFVVWYIFSAGYVELPIVLLYLIRCLVSQAVQNEKKL